MNPTIWFVSDTHFSHAAILRYAERPFADTEEMNETLIATWNTYVNKNDLVYHLGDFSLGLDDDGIRAILARLNGQKRIVVGNHDHRITRHPERFGDFAYVYPPFHEAKIGGQRMTLCHYALKVWPRSHFGAFHLYGHSHGNLFDDPHSLSMDVGVDPTAQRTGEYRPISLEEVTTIMATKEFQPVDHHQMRE